MNSCLRVGTGDPSQNLTLGGIDAAGRDCTNLLQYCFLHVVGELRLRQPSLSVRWHTGADPEFLRAAAALACRGFGQPAFVSDAAVIPGLEAAGIPVERARDYGIVGCYEAAPPGDCNARTTATVFSLSRVFSDYFQRTQATGLAFLRDGFRAALAEAYAGVCLKPTSIPSPFGSALLGGCIESARYGRGRGERFDLFGVNVHGLGSTVDALHVVSQAVWQERIVSLPSLQAAVAGDFPDETLRRRLLSIGGRYGTDTPATNELAHWLSREVAQMILASGDADGPQPYPGFFAWQHEAHDHSHAGPEGRRCADFLSYGAGPAPSTVSSPTAVLASASHVAHDLSACGNPLELHLPIATADSTGEHDRVAALITGYFRQGGFHVHINTVDAEVLRSARRDPEHHQDLIVRISGLSAHFVRLTPEIQEAVIRRAEAGGNRHHTTAMP